MNEEHVNREAIARKLIVVLDTNVLVRVLLAKSPLTRTLRDSLQRSVFILLISDEILLELGRVLRYPRIALRHHLTEANIRDFENTVRSLAVIVPGLYAVSKVEADPSDDKFLACALEGDADYVVSEDPHLRDLKEYQGIAIIGLEQFSQQLGLS